MHLVRIYLADSLPCYGPHQMHWTPIARHININPRDLEYGVLYEAEVDEKYRGVKQVAGVVNEADMVSQEVGPEPRVLYWYSPLILNTHS